MVPEETVKASMDLKAKVMMPIHWGAFSLSLHSWDDPIIRVTKEARELNLPITVPMIGEIIDLNKIHLSVREWWNKEIL
jgi:L-ascorbate metabolism protein UlaG (beta-lactamase superfamily)